MLVMKGWISSLKKKKKEKAKQNKKKPVQMVKVSVLQWETAGMLWGMDVRAAMPEEPQARWVSVWIAGTEKRSIQSPAGYVLVISRVEALLHPFIPQPAHLSRGSGCSDSSLHQGSSSEAGNR